MNAGSAWPAPIADLVDAALELSVVGSFTRLGSETRRHVFGWDEPAADALDGRTALVTGATSGLGLAAAQGLARAGATVIVLGRDPDRADRARAAIEAATGREAKVAIADLGRLVDVRRVADEIRADHDRLDVVVHNAGTLVHDLELTEDGLEVTVQTHVVAPFLLSAALYPLLTDTAGARVITVTSGGMYTTGLDLDTLVRPDAATFDGVKAYARAKRAQVVLTEQWAARSAGSGISFHAMHPGWADTAGLERSLPGFHRVLKPILRSPEEGVETTVWLATADEPLQHNGSLWLDRRRRRTTYLPRTATDPRDAGRLWAWCCEQAGVDDPTLTPPRTLR